MAIPRRCLSLWCFILMTGLHAQQPVSRELLHYRVYAIVPIIGNGTPEDPRRPAYIPSPTERKAAGNSIGLMGYSAQLSDDGKFALVEYVARNRAAMAGLLADKSPDVKIFENHKSKKEDVEAEFRKKKANFKIEKMGVSLP